MASVMLKKKGPRRVSTHGVLFEREVPREVGGDVAAALSGDLRFLVKFDSPAEAAAAVEASTAPETKSGRPVDKGQRLSAIRAAVDNLDVDNEGHWTNDGKPDARALTHLLGWQVTAEERDAAMPKTERPSAGVVKPEKPHTGNVKIVRHTPAGGDQAASGPLLDTGKDSTIDDAVEV